MSDRSGRFGNPGGQAAEAAGEYTRALLELLGDRDPFEVQEELLPALEELTSGLSDDELRQPEAPGKWSIVEVVQHLADSEIIYGYRMRLIVAHDRPALPGYDQDLWADRLRYREVAFEDAVGQLRDVRRVNLRWLRTLEPGEWEREGVHGERGVESVRHVFELLAAHDLVHRRQVERIRTAIGR